MPKTLKTNPLLGLSGTKRYSMAVKVIRKNLAENPGISFRELSAIMGMGDTTLFPKKLENPKSSQLLLALRDMIHREEILWIQRISRGGRTFHLLNLNPEYIPDFLKGKPVLSSTTSPVQTSIETFPNGIQGALENLLKAIADVVRADYEKRLEDLQADNNRLKKGIELAYMKQEEIRQKVEEKVREVSESEKSWIWKHLGFKNTSEVKKD